MSDRQRISLDEQNVGQAIASLKKGSYLLKYGRRGKPKFCPFRLSNDEKTIIWYVQKKEKQLPLSHVSRIMPGQRTAVFQRYPRPEKEYQSFSLLYGNRSLDVICKDKGEAEIWNVALRALISKNNCQIWSSAIGNDNISSDGSSSYTPTKPHLTASNSSSDIVYEESDNNEPPIKNTQQKNLGRVFSDLLLYTKFEKSSPQIEFTPKLQYPGELDDHYARTSADSSQLSLTSAVSSASHISLPEDFKTLHDVFIWGEGTGDGLLGGSVKTVRNSNSSKTDSHFPKALESTMPLDVRKVSCGRKHAVLVTKHCELYSWGDGSGGRLGHGVESDASTPKPVTYLTGLNIELTACGDYHTCAVTQSGDLYTWGDITHNSGILGHGTELGRWTPKKVKGQLEGMHITFISCGPWHTAAVTSEGLLFTFGDGTFGALGHGNSTSTCCPRVVEALKGLRTVRVSCGVWHTAAIVEVGPDRNLFTWGNGDRGQLGHSDKDTKFFPSCVVSLHDTSFSQVACGESMTVALTITGQVYTMGGSCFKNEANLPLCIEGKLKDSFVEEISCGSHHVAILNSNSEVYTWGKGANGQLGHGDNQDRNIPTLVEALSKTRVKSVMCGSNMTVAICVHKQVCTAELSMCSGCHSPFNFKRKRHNCYNCGLVFCKPCSSRKSLKASLAPDTDRPYRVCEACYSKLHKESSYLPPKVIKGNGNRKSGPDPKPQGLLSRLSSFDSFKRSSNQLLKTESSQDLSNSYTLSSHNRSFRREYSFMSNSEYSGGTAASLPGSTICSQAASPVSSVQSSPNHSTSLSSGAVAIELPEAKEDDSKRTNDDLIKEIATLREQVEFLSHKSQVLESELERTSRQLKEATKLAMDEGEKTKAAKEVIKTLTTQAFKMSET